ncbi:MAG: 4Fe-4S binding protein [Betaproteobacteria bacterium]
MTCNGEILTRVADEAAPAADPTGVTYVSRGAVLVFGPSRLVLPAARALAPGLRVLAGVREDVPATRADANPAVMTAVVAQVEGYLGRFRIMVHAGAGKQVDLGPFSPNRDGQFDLVLDLDVAPSIAVDIAPPGYFAPGDDPQRIAEAVAELKSLVGTFRKPRYFQFDAVLCAHIAQGVTGCTRCIAACPAGAIRPGPTAVDVDPYLCQGCSTCVLACPTGAITPARPVARPTRPAADGRAVLLIVEDGDNPVGASLVSSSASTTTQSVSAIGMTGIAMWLEALANGFDQVIVRAPPALPPSTRAQLSAQIALAQALLRAVGRPDSGVVLEDGATGNVTTVMSVPPGDLAALASDRPGPATGRPALMGSLAQLEGPRGPASLRTPHPLPPGAPFGAIEVNRDTCTLCLACVNLCPTGALAGTQPRRELEFVEERCVQCGICERGCPEQAIRLEPRLLVPVAARSQPRSLNEDQPHRCTACGTAFISRAMLAKGIQIMQQHQTLDEAGVAVLRLCPACRAARLTESLLQPQ